VVAILAFVMHRLRRLKAQLGTAIEHMSQGLCLYGGDERLVFCNQRYVEMYGFPPGVVKPGSSLSDVLAYRVARGTLSGDPEQYRAELMETIRAGKTTSNVVESGDGRF